MVGILLNWLCTAAVVYGLSRALPGVRCKDFTTAAIVAAVYGLLNSATWFLMTLLSLGAIPLIGFLFLGFFFALIVNSFVLYATDQLIEDFEIDGVGTTVLMAALISLASVLFRGLLM